MLLASVPCGVGEAQITLDGSLGGPSGPLNGPDYQIDSTLGVMSGSNLFHSFREFNLRTMGSTIESATFTNTQPVTISNVISRVTGGAPSMIDGLLRSTVLGANLYLLNPRGVMFGQNASLDVSGAFHVSTADYLRFADGAKFYANPATPSNLTVASPAAFGFLTANPSPITISGSVLRVNPGQTLSVVGGGVQLAGATLSAPSGRVNIASVGPVASADAPGEVRIVTAEGQPDLAVEGFQRLGGVEVSQQSKIDASGDGGGTVTVRAGSLRLDDSNIFVDTAGSANGAPVGIDIAIDGDLVVTNGAQITTDVSGAGRAGDVRISAANFELSDRSAFIRSVPLPGSTGDGGNIAIQVPGRLQLRNGVIQNQTQGGGRAGDISVEAGSLQLTEGGQIENSTRDAGRAGTTTITATESVAVSGRSVSPNRTSGIISNTTGTGAAGQVIVRTPNLAIDFGLIQAVSLAGATGRGGDVVLEVGNLSVTGGAQIDSSTRGAGQGGTVTINATEAVSISGRDSSGFSSLLSAITSGTGSGGQVVVSAPALTLADVGAIVTQANAQGAAGDIVLNVDRLVLTGGAMISAATRSSGSAGAIRILVRNLTVERGALINNSTVGTAANAGAGGTTTVTATESVTVSTRRSNGARPGIISNTQGPGAAGQLVISTPSLTSSEGLIQARTLGPGAAGDIVVEVGRLTLTDGAQIDVSTRAAGRGGSATVRASEAVVISGRDRTDSRVSSGVFGSTLGSGPGGQVTVTTPVLTMTDGAAIAAGKNTSIEVPTGGRAGDIVVNAQQLVLDRGAQINSDSLSVGTVKGGNIDITARSVFVGQSSGVTTDTLGADGGNITLHVVDIVQLVDGRITATAKGGQGSGGNITIDPEFVVLDHSQIRADAQGGPGGNITIVAGTFLTTDSAVTASSATNVQGTVSITEETSDLSRTVVRLPEAPLQAAALLRESCAARFAEGKISTLALGTRDGVPPEPGDFPAKPLSVLRSEAEPPPASPRTAERPPSRRVLVQLRCGK
jgi:filamentous hemagglutinin family protein